MCCKDVFLSKVSLRNMCFLCECLCHLFQKDHQKASRRIATLLGTNQKDTGTSMDLSRCSMTPIEVVWIRPVNR